MRNVRAAAVLGSLCWALVSAGCIELPELQEGLCGNAIIEPDQGEECDTFAVGSGARCRATGEPGQCRYDCTKDASGEGPSCPAGWGCGTDGICRQPTGTFDPGTQPFEANAFNLKAADFDGDGRSDLLTLTASELSATYFSTSSQLESTFRIPAAYTTAAIGQLTEDARTDLAFGDPAGLSVMRAQADRTLSPTTYSSFKIPEGSSARFAFTNVIPSAPGDDLVAVMEIGGAAVLGHVTSTVTGETDLEVLAGLPAGPEDIAGGIVVANLIDDATSPCDDVVLASKSLHELAVYSPCRVDPVDGTTWNLEAEPHLVMVAPENGAIESVIAADLNRDGHLDLLVMTDGKQVLTAFGFGDGTFASQWDLGGTLGYAEPSTSIFEPVLAAGDLDGDGWADLITTWSMWLTGPSAVTDCGYFGSQVAVGAGPGAGGGVASGAGGAGGAGGGGTDPSLGLYSVCSLGVQNTAYASARIADLNNNGIVDLVIVPETGTGLEFLNGVGDGRFNRFTISTNAPVTELAVGDFDGDLVTDLAIGQGGTESEGDPLAVLFGRPVGAPEAPVEIGRLGRIVEIASGDFTKLGTTALDAQADMAALSKADDAYSLAIISGRGDRQLQSPFSFIYSKPGAGPVQALIDQVVIGNFTDDEHPDIAALALEINEDSARQALWLATSSGEAELATEQPSDASSLPPDYAWYAAVMAAVDLGNGPTDEIVAVVDGFGVVAQGEGDAPPDGLTGALLVASVDAGKLVPTSIEPFDSVTTYTGGPFAIPSRVSLVDVDGDGERDVVILSIAFDGIQRLSVLLNQGNGDLDLGSRIDLILGSDEAPIGEKPGMDRLFALGLAGIQLDADSAQEIVIVTTQGSYWTELENGALKEPIAIDGLPPAQAVAAGDFNGDGIEDLALAFEKFAQIFPGRPVRP